MSPGDNFDGLVPKSQNGPKISLLCRPCKLTDEEEEHLVTAVRFLRRKGAPVDGQVLCEMAEELVERMRAQPPQWTFNRDWVKSFRKRHKLTRYFDHQTPSKGCALQMAEAYN